MSSLKRVGGVLVLLITFLVLFSVSGQLLIPPELVASAPTDAASMARSTGALLVMAVVDLTFILGLVLTSRLRGASLWLLTSALYWGTKTFTGQLEAWYFMPNVSAALVPALMLLTVPVAVVVPLLAVVLFGRWSGHEEAPAWRVPPMGAAQQLWKWTLLSALVYPALFFLAGYYIAFASEEVRAFYGGIYRDTFVEHLRAVVKAEPRFLPFEALRGALWVAMAVAVLWTTRGRTWVGGLWVVLLFTLVQNDVHLLPNPLMPPTVQAFHFVETVSSNAVFALLIIGLMSRAHFGGKAGHRHQGPAAPGLSHAR